MRARCVKTTRPNNSTTGDSVRRQTLTPAAFEVFKVERLSVAVVGAFSRKAAQRVDGDLTRLANISKDFRGER
jgi:hypothetical protein